MGGVDQSRATDKSSATEEATPLFIYFLEDSEVQSKDIALLEIHTCFGKVLFTL